MRAILYHCSIFTKENCSKNCSQLIKLGVVSSNLTKILSFHFEIRFTYLQYGIDYQVALGKRFQTSFPVGRSSVEAPENERREVGSLRDVIIVSHCSWTTRSQ